MTPLEINMAVADVHKEQHVTIIDRRIRMVRKMFGQYVAPDSRILDVGCGGGEILEPFAPNAIIIGVEASEWLAEAARRRGYVTVIPSDLNDSLPCCSNAYNAVFFGEIVEHLPDVDNSLSQINRVLVKDGLLIMTFTNIRTPIGLAMMILQNRPPMGSARYRSPHFKDFTTATMKIALENNGLKILRMHGTTLGMPDSSFLSWLAYHLPSWSTQVVVVARKMRDVVYDKNEVGRFEIYE